MTERGYRLEVESYLPRSNDHSITVHHGIDVQLFEKNLSYGSYQSLVAGKQGNTNEIT